MRENQYYTTQWFTLISDEVHSVSKWNITENVTDPGLSIHLCPIAEKDANDVSLVRSSCQMQWCLSTNSGDIRISIMLQQVNNDVHAAHKAGHVQRSEARLKDKHILHYQP